MEKIKRKSKRIIKIGDKFNFLTVLNYSHKDKYGNRWYDVECDCGKIKKVKGAAMVSNNTMSCGCYSKRVNKRRILPNDMAIKSSIILTYKNHAKRRGIDYNISDEDFLNLIDKPCYYCGIPPSNIKKNKNHLDGFLYNGIDRLDSNIGYNKINCVPCCGMCNSSKMKLSKSNFLDWIKRVYEHSFKDGIK